MISNDDWDVAPLTEEDFLVDATADVQDSYAHWTKSSLCLSTVLVKLPPPPPFRDHRLSNTDAIGLQVSLCRMLPTGARNPARINPPSSPTLQCPEALFESPPSNRTQ
jgi:hypothetical protein